MKLRDKLLVPIGLALLGVIAINLGALWAASAAWEQVDAERVTGHATTRLVLRAEIGFKRQVQEWKNILLRGGDERDRLHYHAQFRVHEDAVRTALGTTAADPTLPAWARDEVRELLAEHRSLGLRYREALDVFQTRDEDPIQAADGMVRGVDRDLSERLESFGQRLQAGVDARAAAASRRGGWTVFGLTIGALALSLLIIAMLLSVVHHLIVRPARLASQVSESLLQPAGANTEDFDQHRLDIADDELGQLLRALLSLHDALHDERERLDVARKDLNRARAAAEAGAEAKQAFLARVTHELRTPLNGVVGSIALLKDEPLNDDARILTQAAEESSQRLASLVEDILEFTQASGGDLDMRPHRFDIATMMQGVVAGLRPRAQAHGCQLILATAAGGPREVFTDRERLARVVDELVTNAINATPDGHVEIILTTADSGSHVQVRIDVVDDGEGIPEEQRAEIFQPFTQVEEGYDRGKQGAGLGLPMCSRIVEHMGGQLAHEAVPGGGSRFWISLRLPRASHPSIPEIEPGSMIDTPLPGCDDGDRVLLVGRGPADLLTELGLPVRRAEGLDEALLALAEESFPIAIVDVLSVGMGTIVDLRDMADSAGHLTALVACTRAEDRDPCLADGWDDVIVQDADRAEVVELLGRWLDQPLSLAG